MINIGIHGGNGKMGMSILESSKRLSNAKTSVIFSTEPLKNKTEILTTDNYEIFFDNCDVIIDFTSKDGAANLLKYAIKHQKPICMGTTGLDEECEKLLKECSKIMPIIYATNTSLGVAILNSLVKIASEKLKDFDIEIVEMHHRNKKDAPSGTALTLANTAAKARNLDLKKVRVSARDGLIGARTKDEIAVMSLRGGDIVGKHTVGFYNDGEFIELNHTATSRATFANGALKCAIWVCNKKPGLYNINEVLGI